MDQNIALQLYKSIIGPHFDYCDTTYMTASMESLNKLQLLQNVCCYIILRADRYAPIAEMHRELRLMTLANRREYHLGQLCHKNIHFDGVARLSKLFVKTRPTRSTRQSATNHMMVSKCRTVIGGKAISVRGPKFWNGLCTELRTTANYSAFSTTLKSKITEIWDNHPT